MKQEYKDLIKGIDLMGKALVEIGNSQDNKPIKMLVAKFIDKLGFNDPSVGDDVAMIRFAVVNDDESLEKLTAQITGSQNVTMPVAEPLEVEKLVEPVAKPITENDEPVEK